MNRMPRILMLLALTLALAACSGNKTKPEQEGSQGGQPTTTEQAPGAETMGTEQGGTFTGAELDNPDSPLYKKVVHFDFDKSTVKDEDRDTIKAHGEYLANHPNARVTLEGHADERGSREYNLGLGERRADAVAELMQAFGASDDQITRVSYGEEQPVATCHEESCWWQNRRVEIIYTDRG